MADAEIVAVGTEMANIGIDMAAEQGIMPLVDSEIQPFLRQAAQNYLDILAKLEDDLNLFKLKLQRFQQLRHELRALNKDVNLNTVDNYVKQRQEIRTQLQAAEFIQELYIASFNFQNQLNLALGQKIVTVFVFMGKAGPELWEVDSKELIKFDYDTAGNLVARYRNLTKEMQNSFQRLKKDTEFQEQNPAKAQGLKNTYKEVIRRYNISKKHGSHIVLWKIGKWNGLSVSSAGDIKEAYAMFVITNPTIPTFLNDMETNVKDYMLSGVANIDNISGMLQGDITQGNIEYAIKSVNATTLGTTQLKLLAQEIIADNGFGKEQLLAKKEQLKNQGQIRNKVIEGLEAEYEGLLSILNLK